MRVRKPGRVGDHIWFLGREESGVYLLEGEDGAMVISGGMSYIVPEILQQFDEFRIGQGFINTNHKDCSRIVFGNKIEENCPPHTF